MILFVRDLTVIDAAYLCPHRGVVGERDGDGRHGQNPNRTAFNSSMTAGGRRPGISRSKMARRVGSSAQARRAFSMSHASMRLSVAAALRFVSNATRGNGVVSHPNTVVAVSPAASFTSLAMSGSPFPLCPQASTRQNRGDTSGVAHAVARAISGESNTETFSPEMGMTTEPHTIPVPSNVSTSH